MAEIYVARQPIFDDRQQVVGYEILHRSGPQNVFVPIDPDVASSAGVENAMMSIGLEQLTGGRLAFVNVSRRVLLEETYTLLPADRTVLELLETVAPDDAVVDACRRLKHHGYRLALDDFTGQPGTEPLLELADIVKIDVLQSNSGQALRTLDALQRRGVQLLAEKVETQQMLSDTRAQGYDLFQGYFFCRPEMVRSKELSPSNLNAIRFLSEVCRPDVSFEALEDIFKHDVSLATRLLRYLNSAGVGWTHEIRSIYHALRLVGLRQLQKWGAILSVVTLSADGPRELASTALARAHFAESIGARTGPPGQTVDCFLTGLLSLMDAIVGRPIGEVLESMTVSESVRGALLGEATPLGEVLQLVVAYERADWPAVHSLGAARGLAAAELRGAYLGSVRWAAEALEV